MINALKSVTENLKSVIASFSIVVCPTAELHSLTRLNIKMTYI